WTADRRSSRPPPTRASGGWLRDVWRQAPSIRRSASGGGLDRPDPLDNRQDSGYGDTASHSRGVLSPPQHFPAAVPRSSYPGPGRSDVLGPTSNVQRPTDHDVGPGTRDLGPWAGNQGPAGRPPTYPSTAATHSISIRVLPSKPALPM